MQILDQTTVELISTILKNLSEGVKVKVEDFVIDSPVVATKFGSVSRPHLGVARDLPGNTSCSRLRKVLEEHP
jgi:hypothetical protein